MPTRNVIDFPRAIFTVTVRESVYTTLCFPAVDSKGAKRFAEKLMASTSDEAQEMQLDFTSNIKRSAPVAVSIDLADGSTH